MPLSAIVQPHEPPMLTSIGATVRARAVSRPAKRRPGPKPKLVLSDTLLDQIRALGRIQATVEESAAVLRVSLRTLQNFFTANPDAKEAHEGGKLEGCASLRRKQFAMAETNAGMAIFLGKNYLGQKDKHELAGDPLNPIQTINKIEVVIVDPKA